MRRIVPLLLVLTAGVAVGQEKKPNQPKEAPIVKPREGKTETIKLFNGKTLDGWEGYSDLWSVKEGVIVAKNKDPLKFSTYLLTKNKYTDFRLTFAAKLVESEMHSGVSFWGTVKPDVSKEPEKDRTTHTYAGHLVMFPSGWGMYDLFGRNGLPVDGGPAKKVGKQHDWNDMEILAQGNRIRLAVNGTQVVDWRDPEPNRIKEGPIGLQLHKDAVQEVRFKGLTLETFPKEDRLLSVATSLFNGKDLTGWQYKGGAKFDGKTEADDGRYSAKDGILTVNPGKGIKQLWTTAEFPKDFELTLEFRAAVNADSGIFVRRPQLQCRDYLVAGPYKNLKKYKPQDWNEVVVTVKGTTAHCTCNGEVLEGALKVPETGGIGLEADRGQMEYRNIRLRELK
jgi:3-keto-disaccharide hydrolase